MPQGRSPISDLARMYRERIPTAPKSIGRQAPAIFSSGRNFGFPAPVGRFVKTAVESLDPRFIASEGGRSVQHVVGDATELGRSIITGEDTLSESPTARAYQAAGGGAPGVLAAVLPYVNVGTAVLPTTRVLTPTGRLAMAQASQDAVNAKLAQAAAAGVDAQSAALQAARSDALAGAKTAVAANDLNAYDRAVGEYLNALRLRYTKPSDVYDGRAYGRLSSAETQAIANSRMGIARDVNVGVGGKQAAAIAIDPDKALALVSEGQPYGAMFDPEKMAQIASERQGYRSHFSSPAKRSLMESSGVDVSNLSDYEIDRLIVESEILGVPFSAPTSRRPIYAATPEPKFNPGLSGYARSPDDRRFTVEALYDVTGRPTTVLPMDSFPSMATSERPRPLQLADLMGRTKYQEMQIGGGPLPIENLQNLAIAFESPESLRFTNPEQFYSYLDRFYPERTGYTLTGDLANAEARVNYLNRQLALLKAAQEKGLPVTTVRTGGLKPEVSAAIQEGRPILRQEFDPKEMTGLWDEYSYPGRYETISDPAQQTADIEEAIARYNSYIDWASRNSPAIQARADKINELSNRSFNARIRANLRATEKAAQAKAVGGVTEDVVAEATKVLPYPANEPAEASRFLAAAFDGDIEKAGDIYLDINSRWRSELANESYPSDVRYFMATDTEGLFNLSQNGIVPGETISKIISYINNKTSPAPIEMTETFSGL